MHATVRDQIAVLAIAFLLYAVSTHAHVTTVAAGEKLVLSEVIPAQSGVTFTFQVVGDEDKLNVTLTDETGEILGKFGLASIGNVSVKPSVRSHVVSATLDNSNSRFSSVSVAFDFNDIVDYNFGSDKDTIDPMERVINTIAQTMHELEVEQGRVRVEQANHRETVEAVKIQLTMWSVFQILVFVGMSGFQLVMLRRLLERKTFY